MVGEVFNGCVEVVWPIAQDVFGLHLLVVIFTQAGRAEAFKCIE